MAQNIYNKSLVTNYNFNKDNDTNKKLGITMSNISIYIITHKKYEMPSDKIYQPLFVGAFDKDETFGYLRDDEGLDNISKKNIYFSELTGLYWIWKHNKSDIVGLCHYRRYFVKGILGSGDYLNKEDISKTLEKFDVIAYKKFSGVCVFDAFNKFVSKENLEKSLNILQEVYPGYHDDMKAQFKKKEYYAHCMFISSKDFLNEYCEWLFKYLFELEKELDLKKNHRVIGYVAELLFSVYLEHNNFNVKCYPLKFVEAKSNIIANIINNSRIISYIYYGIYIKNVK